METIVSGLCTLKPAAGVRPNVTACADSSRPSRSDTALRAGCDTPVANSTPIDPARGLVNSRTVGLPARLEEPVDEVRP